MDLTVERTHTGDRSISRGLLPQLHGPDPLTFAPNETALRRSSEAVFIIRGAPTIIRHIWDPAPVLLVWPYPVIPVLVEQGRQPGSPHFFHPELSSDSPPGLPRIIRLQTVTSGQKKRVLPSFVFGQTFCRSQMADGFCGALTARRVAGR